MNLFLLNALLAIGWCAIFGSFTLSTLLVGFLLAYAALWAARPLYGPTRYFHRVPRLVSLFFYFLWELVVASLRVAWDVVTPPIYSRPGIIAVPLDAETDFEITVLGHLISLTPGTLSLDVSPDRRTLYVHAMFVDDPDELRRQIKAGMERRVLEALR